MTILIAPDSFKDALPAMQVCEAIRRGVRSALPGAKVYLCPLADGGEGTVEVLNHHLGGSLVSVTVPDPLGRPTEARFLTFGKKAFVEMAQASGLELLSPEERNPLKTSTFGTGELLRAAYAHGAEEVFLAVGGSSTNDAGMGMAAALGYRFLDENGQLLEPIGQNLLRVQEVLPPESTAPMPKLTVLTDVANPLYGPTGAAHVFAAQKGADAQAIELLDTGLRHFSTVVKRSLGHDFSKTAGVGAAGGLGFGAVSMLGASLQAGAEAILQLIGFERLVKQADLIITGEGRLDAQTLGGKLVSAVCQSALKFNIPVVAVCGQVDASKEQVARLGLQAALQLRRPDELLETALSRTAAALETKVCNFLRITDLGK